MKRPKVSEWLIPVLQKKWIVEKQMKQSFNIKISGNEKDWHTNLNWATTGVVWLWTEENLRVLKYSTASFSFN
jgi:hypothetical protein